YVWYSPNTPVAQAPRSPPVINSHITHTSYYNKCPAKARHSLIFDLNLRSYLSIMLSLISL
ncbi:hypothetical protein, partial [Cloacibacillus porcorum]